MSHKFLTKIISLPLEDSLNRTLAQDIYADLDAPPFHRVSMDGIAINKKLLSSTSSFKILECISAGSEERQLPSGDFCFEIMTGAVLPKNADLVIRYEDLKIADGQAKITCDHQRLSLNYHAKGSDYKRGDKLLSAGTFIKSTTTAILASAGRAHVLVYDLPKIAVISTGDELVDIAETPAAHQIRWSNGISLRQELYAHGFCDVSIYKVSDNQDKIRNLIKDLLVTKDILLITGGVSAGKFDFVPRILAECQVAEIFHKVTQRPGKPLWFGKSLTNCLVFGLPGNPLSCLVNLRKFVIPLLLTSLANKKIKTSFAILAEEVNFNQGLTYYCLVKIKSEEGRLMAYPIKGNGSGDFFQMKDSDGFIELKKDQGPFKAGHLAGIYYWGSVS